MEITTNQSRIGMTLGQHPSSQKNMGKILKNIVNTEEVIHLYNEGLTTVHISKLLHTNRTKISKILEENGIKRRGVLKVIDSLKATELYLSGKSLSEVGILLNVSQTVIERCLKETNTPKRGQNDHVRKYFFNESYFEKIDTEKKAYFLGFLYADGNVTKDKSRVQFRIQEEDIKILEWFKEELGDCAPISFIKAKNERCKNQIGLYLSSRKMAQDLINLGCIPNKSLTLKFPTEEQVPSYLIHHFIRGYFDGDGCITLNKRGKTKSAKHFSITGAKECLIELQKVLMINCNLNKCTIFRSKQHKEETRTLSYGGNIQVKRIADYLYKEATIYLQRKYDKFLYEGR